MTAPGTNAENAFTLAKERYAEWGVDVESALRRLSTIAISLHCWQGDDVGGFENTGQELGGGLAVTGNYPGKARTADELRSDLDKALSLLPGTHRLNLHASYAETGGRKVERDALQPEHFRGWIDWAKARGIGMDFNPTYFAHPMAADGYTLAHPDEKVRRFWIDHGIACRRIGAAIGKALGTPCVTNVWIPDGSKDTPVDRKAPAPTAGRRARRDLRRTDRPEVQPRRRRGQALRHRLGELRRRLARVLPRLRRHPQEAALPRRRTFPSDRGRLRQDLRRAPVPRRDPAAREPRRALGQRSRRGPLRRAGGDRPGAGPGRLPRPRAHRARLLRREHQPRRRLGDRRSSDAQGAVARPARADRDACASSRPRGTTPRGWRCSKSSRRSPSAPSGTITAAVRASRPAATGWRRSRLTSATCSRNGTRAIHD